MEVCAYKAQQSNFVAVVSLFYHFCGSSGIFGSTFFSFRLKSYSTDRPLSFSLFPPIFPIILFFSFLVSLTASTVLFFTPMRLFMSTLSFEFTYHIDSFSPIRTIIIAITRDPLIKWYKFMQDMYLATWNWISLHMCFSNAYTGTDTQTVHRRDSICKTMSVR